MSYDLLVFDPEVAPRDRDAFMAWYQELVKWGEDRDYSSPEGTSEKLRAFYDRMRIVHPPMNGPDAYKPEEANEATPEKKTGFWAKLFGPRYTPPPPKPKINEAFIIDYTIAKDAIYMAFSSSVIADGYSNIVSAAIQTDVGFFDVSANKGVIMHDRDQLLTLEIL